MIWVWGYLIGAAVALVAAIWASDDPRDAVPCVVAAAMQVHGLDVFRLGRGRPVQQFRVNHGPARRKSPPPGLEDGPVGGMSQSGPSRAVDRRR